MQSKRDYYAHARTSLGPRNAEPRGKPKMQSHRPQMLDKQAMDPPWTPQEVIPRSQEPLVYMKGQVTVTMILRNKAPRWQTVRSRSIASGHCKRCTWHTQMISRRSQSAGSLKDVPLTRSPGKSEWNC